MHVVPPQVDVLKFLVSLSRLTSTLWQEFALLNFSARNDKLMSPWAYCKALMEETISHARYDEFRLFVILARKQQLTES